MKNIRSIVLTAICLLLFLPAAMAAAPKDGVYEQHDENGRLMAKLLVMTPEGSTVADGRNWGAAKGAPYIAMIAYDEDGAAFELAGVYLEKGELEGVLETAVIFNRNDILQIKKAHQAMGKRIRKGAGYGELNMINRHKLAVNIHSGNRAIDGPLSGIYEEAESDSDILPIMPSVFMLAFEQNRAPEVYENERNLPYSCAIVPNENSKLPISLVQYELMKGGGARHTFYVEKNFSLIMELDRNTLEYSFPFVNKDYLERCRTAWEKATPSAASDANALWLHHYLLTSREYGNLLDNKTVLRLTDYKTKGKRRKAVTTCEYRLIKKAENEPETELLRAEVNDKGQIEIIKVH